MLKKLFTLCLTIVFSFLFITTDSFAASNLKGEFPIQQATIDDATGEYTFMLLNTPAGSSPILTTDNVQMARLTDEEVSEGKKTYAEIKGNEAILHLTEDFRLEYVHNETQIVDNPNTGRQETVIVRRESSFWTPFAGAMAGQALGSLLFAPRYYMPPVYVSGRGLTGVGGYGNTYNQAVKNFSKNNNSVPAMEKNRKSFRKTGSLKSQKAKGLGKSNKKNMKSTGSGVGSNRLKNQGKSSSKRLQQNRRNSFGSNRGGGTRRRTMARRSFGRRR